MLLNENSWLYLLTQKIQNYIFICLFSIYSSMYNLHTVSSHSSFIQINLYKYLFIYFILHLLFNPLFQALLISTNFYIIIKTIEMLPRIQQLHETFAAEQKNYRPGPIKIRSCKDICCLITFFILILAFIAIGLYYLITVGQKALSPNFESYNYLTQPLTVIKQLFVKYWHIILGMFVLSFILSIIFLVLLRYCTKCMVYTLIICTILIMLGIIGISIISKAWGTLIAMSVALLIFLCLLFCYRSFIQKGVILLRATMQFIKNRPSVYLVPLSIFILGILFLVFWIVTLICMQYHSSKLSESNLNNAKQIVFYIFWIFMIVFIGIFFYYVMVFLVAYMCANWYYGHQRQGCCIGWKMLNRAHIGSITFATLLITLVKAIQYLGSSAYRRQSAAGNSCSACCLCILSCCFQQIQYILQVLNRNSVIAMALTGHGYISSAKLALSVLFKDFPLFFITNAMGELLKFGGIVFCAGIPTLLAYLLIHSIFLKQGGDSYQMTILILLVFLIGMFISYFFVSMISIALSSVFFFFCLDRRYRDIGHTVDNTPPVIRNLEDTGRFQYQMVPKSTERLY